MATTFTDLDGNGQASRQFSFPSIKEADIKVDVDGTLYDNRSISGASVSATTFTISNYTTTGGGYVVFDTAPASSSNKIRIFRDTDVDTALATFVAGSSVKAGDLNNNQTQLLYAAQEEQNQTVLASDIKDGAVLMTKLPTSAVTLPGNISVTHSNLDTDSVRTNAIQDSNVTTAKIANDNVTTAKIADNAVTMAKLNSGALPTDITVASANLVNGTVATADIADSNITTDKIADGNVTTVKIADDNVTMAKLGSGALPTDITVASANIVDGTIATADIADNAVTMAKLNSGALPTDITVASANLVSGTIAAADIGNDQINSQHYAAGSIDLEHMSANSVDSDQYVDGSIDTAHIASAQVTDAKLASNSVITSKITDANVTTAKIADSNITLAKLASDLKQTSISDSDTQLPTSGAVVDYVAAQLAPLGGLEVIATEVAFPNTQPSSGVVISISDAGGVVVNGSGVSTTGRTVGGSTVTINGFPSSLQSKTMAAGVGLMVSSTGSSQTYTYHKLLAKEADVEQLSNDINDFAARYRVGSSNPTSNNDAGDLFFNTGSSKLLVYNATNTAWEETQTVGNFFINTISSSSGTGGGSATFNGSAYRFTISNAGTYAQQHLVSINGVVQKPNSGTSQPSEGFAIDGGDIIFSSAPPNGADFFIITIGASVSIGTPSDGTVSTAKLASGAVTTAKIADDAVTDAKLANSINTAIAANTAKTTNATHTGDVTGSTSLTIANNAVTTDKIADSTGLSDGVTTAKIANLAVTTAKIANGNVTLDKLPAGNGSNNGKFLRANNNASPSFEVVDTDLVADTSPQLGGNLASNGNDILIADNDAILIGSGSDLQLYHDGNHSYVKDAGTGQLRIQSNAFSVESSNGVENMIFADENGAVTLYHDNSAKFATISTGATVTGRLGIGTASPTDPLHVVGTSLFAGNTYVTGNFYNLADNKKIHAGASNDIRMYHDGSDSYFDSVTGHLYVYNHASSKAIVFGTQGNNRFQISDGGHLIPSANNTYDLGTPSYRWRNIYTNDLHLSNVGHTNDVDGTWGDWTIQEGESDLFLKNNRSGKKYKFNLTEVS